jgi:TMEM175 potassium channel family protein
VVGRVWIGHHTLFRYLRRIDQRLMGLNLLFLALVAFLPSATAVLGDWGDTGPGTAFYAASIAAVGLTQGALWFHARRAGLTTPDLSPELSKAYLLSLLTLPAVFLVSIRWRS